MRERAGAAQLELERRHLGGGRGDRGLHRLDALLGDGAEELQRDVQVVGSDPSHVVGVAAGEPLHLGLDGREPPADRWRRLDSDEESEVHSTVTLFARLRGWSTSVPFRSATWYARNCSGRIESSGVRSGGAWGTVSATFARLAASVSPSETTA